MLMSQTETFTWATSTSQNLIKDHIQEMQLLRKNAKEAVSTMLICTRRLSSATMCLLVSANTSELMYLQHNDRIGMWHRVTRLLDPHKCKFLCAVA